MMDSQELDVLKTNIISEETVLGLTHTCSVTYLSMLIYTLCGN